MLEQKDVNKSVIEESDDINNKSLGKNEELMGTDVSNQNSNEYKSIKPNFIDTLKASLIDLVVIGGISAVGVFVADAILKLAGYSITQKFQMGFIIFMVVMVLYMSIMESGKKSSTIGKKISGLIITKG
ncbi:RDD family protein [Clostridium tagluense]|uniref:RDD domain-containing protein n=1 Tax=Clostridium tagluense TaxID=360422 RepID=A0A401UHM7_9CLOT|nr:MULTISPECIES: RDD family protein [Clostridium]MBU3126784.1 RDD family protein [Clostridium tagluense]MBW9155007.1 RDD family protein [Clostridium tagluense]MBZ9624619.1 RDD family protein [Clostridium sp. FP2]MCB2310076.1 RDD family protein [Clostridium tagluense]MCB2314394.1 RDD family protein [Clostridium tagluense]